MILGLIMLFIPGPGFLSIFLGMSMLATAKVPYARNIIDKIKRRFKRKK